MRSTIVGSGSIGRGHFVNPRRIGDDTMIVVGAEAGVTVHVADEPVAVGVSVRTHQRQHAV